MRGNLRRCVRRVYCSGPPTNVRCWPEAVLATTSGPRAGEARRGTPRLGYVSDGRHRSEGIMVRKPRKVLPNTMIGTVAAVKDLLASIDARSRQEVERWYPGAASPVALERLGPRRGGSSRSIPSADAGLAHNEPRMTSGICTKVSLLAAPLSNRSTACRPISSWGRAMVVRPGLR